MLQVTKRLIKVSKEAVPCSISFKINVCGSTFLPLVDKHLKLHHKDCGDFKELERDRLKYRAPGFFNLGFHR